MSGADRVARGLLVGRFQPFHSGHLAVVRQIRSRWPGEPLLLAIGSAQESYTLENPFTAAERFEMIRGALEGAGVTGTLTLPLPDIGRHALWVAHTEELLPPFSRVHTQNPLTQLLFERAGYAVERPELVERARFEGRRIRAALAEGGPWKDSVPEAVAAYLGSIGAPDRLRSLARGSAPGSGP